MKLFAQILISLWAVWTFAWDAQEAATGYKLYYWKSTAPKIVYRQPCPASPCKVSVNANYTWWFYVTAYSAETETGPSDKIRIYRGKEKQRVK